LLTQYIGRKAIFRDKEGKWTLETSDIEVMSGFFISGGSDGLASNMFDDLDALSININNISILFFTLTLL